MNHPLGPDPNELVVDNVARSVKGGLIIRVVQLQQATLGRCARHEEAEKHRVAHEVAQLFAGEAVQVMQGKPLDSKVVAELIRGKLVVVVAERHQRLIRRNIYTPFKSIFNSLVEQATLVHLAKVRQDLGDREVHELAETFVYAQGQAHVELYVVFGHLRQNASQNVGYGDWRGIDKLIQGRFQAFLQDFQSWI